MGFPSPGESRGHKFRGTNCKGLLLNVSFAAVLILPSVAVFCCVSGVKEQPVVYLEHSKADREASHGLAVDFFGVLLAMKLFSRNNGFQAFFFAASSIAF